MALCDVLIRSIESYIKESYVVLQYTDVIYNCHSVLNVHRCVRKHIRYHTFGHWSMADCLSAGGTYV